MEFVGREMSIPKEPEQVMKLRDGSVLGKKMILKNDHFPGCQNKRRSRQIQGAPNYRQAYSLRVHGVAVPTAAGIRNVLSHIGAHKDGKRVQVLWISLSEEPVVYLNGRPFVPREVEKPFSNIEYTGINMEQMEARLKEDILIEASRYGNKILVTDELPDGQMVDQWEPVSTDSLKTLLEVYEELQVEGYLVDYERVPVTDGKSPKEADFDTLIRKISQADINTEIIFNCQLGRGRTTTGMLIATLVYFKRTGASDRGLPRNSSSGRIFKPGENITISLPSSDEAIRRGEYDVIRSLIRVLEGGVEGKRQIDEAIDKCASMQNFRGTFRTYRSSIFGQPDEKKRKAALSFFVEYLETYYFLICFAVYLHSEGDFLQSGSLVHVSFADWMLARPALNSILNRQLRRDPLGALGYTATTPSSINIAESTDGLPQSVLGSKTVLKSDHSPSCQSAGVQWRMEGAPNFREVLGFPVYGVANPTIDGIRSVIAKVWSLRGVRPVFWHNMREEPIIYINGKPFVRREVESPYKNMLGCKGIDRDTVEGREASLKEDILREAKRYEGAIMVIHETKDGQIFYLREHVDADSVKTPLEVFKCLEAEGLPIKYARMPITDGKPPKCSDFDTLTSNIASASKDTAFVFNCQMGRGRTTTGTVIACLVKLRISYGRPIKVLYGVQDCERVVELPPIDGEETGSNTEEEPGREFGMDDIPLLLKMTTLFDKGVESREALDAVIDRSSKVQNIREAVLRYRKVFGQQSVEPKVRRAALKRADEHLKTYIWLIAFAAYIGSQSLDVFFAKGESKISFENWLHQRGEMQTMEWIMKLGPRQVFYISESTVNKRRGSGQTSSRLQINEEDWDSTETIRKEAAVNINGTPFVSSELSKHVDTLKDVDTIRLKEDILSEVRESGDREGSLGLEVDRISSLPKELLQLIGSFLDSVRFYRGSSDCVFQLLLSASPELKELKMDGICWESWKWCGILSSESLQRLTISRKEYNGCPDEITFNTPGLLYLDYADCVPRDYPVINFNSLVEAKLKLHLVVNPEWDFELCYDGDRYLSNPAKLIKGIRNVKILEVTSSVEWLDVFRIAIPTLEVYHLTITRVNFSLDYFRTFLTFLLRKTPHLKSLVIKNRKGQTLTFDIPRETITSIIDKLRKRNRRG